MKYFVAYDISDDSTRNKVMKLLNEYGKRVQFSCFEVELEDRQLTMLIKKVEEIIDLEKDKVFFFPISKYALPFIKKLGKVEDDDSTVVL